MSLTYTVMGRYDNIQEHYWGVGVGDKTKQKPRTNKSNCPDLQDITVTRATSDANITHLWSKLN